MNTHIKNKKILISGAGVSGLSLAYWLKQYGFSPNVKENQKLGRIFAINLIRENKSKIAIWLHEQLMRILPGKLADNITKQSVKRVRRAANAIKLKNYE